jgi:hypothetical protein
MGQLPAQGVPEFGEHKIEFLRVIYRDRLATKQTYAFL